MIRKDESDVVYRAVMGKWQAAVVEILRMHKIGRGTDIILGGNAEFMATLKLRELLMQRIVNTMDEMKFERKRRSPLRKNWKVNENLFPCKLSQHSLSLVEDAVQMPVRAWGKRSLTELQAEDHLSYACEKDPIQDGVIAKLRDSSEDIVYEDKIYTEEERHRRLLALVFQELSPFTFKLPEDSRVHIDGRGYALEVLYYCITPLSNNQNPSPFE